MSAAQPLPKDPRTGRCRVVVIINPATRAAPATLARLLHRAAPPEVDLVLHVTPLAGTTVALTRAALPGAQLVVAVGGDGTVADVATALAGTALPLAIIPAGTINLVARELGIPAEVRAAIRLLFGPHRYAVLDVGRGAGRRFVHMAGAGLDSRMFAATSLALKRRLGWLAHVPAATRELRRPPAQVAIIADDVATTVVTPLVLIANGASIITPRLRLYPDIAPDDGWLDLLIFQPRGARQIVQTLAQVGTRRLVDSRYVTRVRAKQIALAAEPPLPVEFDGDVVASTPVTVAVEPAALRIIAPLPKVTAVRHEGNDPLSITLRPRHGARRRRA